MDAAKLYAGNETGVLVVASEQTNGRGQRGRHWLDGDRCTLPCTFVLDTQDISPRMLSVLVGCAVHDTIAGFVPSSHEVMIKWPNDIVIREGEIGEHTDRKLAGILIEQEGSRSRVGIGINCGQGASDWDDSIKNQSVSLSELGVQVSRLDLICSLIEHLSHWLVDCNASAIKAYYQAHDAMKQTHRSFVYDGKEYSGVVQHMDPLDSILLTTQAGEMSLPAAQTHNLYKEPR